MMIRNLVVASLTLALSAVTTFARPTYVNAIPNGSSLSCNACHPNGDTSNFTPFADDFSLTHAWSAALAAKDSDGDGFSNGQELGDPKGVWKSGSALPIPGAQVSNPGDSTSKPTLVPPPVSIASPANGATASAPFVGPITASSTVSSAAITKMQFFSGTTLLGTVSNSPYSLPVNLAAGTYSLTVRATDYLGASNTSAAVQITVSQPVITLAKTPSVTNGSVVLSAGGFTGHGNIVLSMSTNLVDWTPVATNPPATGSVSFTNKLSTNTTPAFYRVVEQ